MLPGQCLCAELVPLALATRVVVLRHKKEAWKPTNTGRLVPLTLEQGEIRVFGAREAPLAIDDLIVPGRRVLLLHPGADSTELAREAGDPRPVTLLVPDANWRRTHKLVAREELLANLSRVHLPPGPPSRYRLRRHPDPRYLATFEAVARALGILEGAAVQAALERVFELLVERVLRSRGRQNALEDEEEGEDAPEAGAGRGS